MMYEVNKRMESFQKDQESSNRVYLEKHMQLMWLITKKVCQDS